MARKLFNHKSSIFTRILIPTIVVLLFQVVLISLVLAANGTLASLEKTATESLFRNAENRSITLENMMVHTFSNLDKLEGDISAIIADHEKSGTTFATREEKQALLDEISDSLLYTLRITSTTGTFMFFVDEAPKDKAEILGLYYRDFNPNMTPTDYSDILLEKGPAAIARKHAIPLSSLWSELYTIDAAYPATYDSIMLPYLAAQKTPKLSSKDLALWGDAHYLDPHSKLDANAFVSYTRPLIVNGKLVGVIGIELQLEYLKKYFPYSDLGDLGGYMLLRYNTDETIPDQLDCLIAAATGSYIKRLGDYGSSLALESKKDAHTYTTSSDSFVPTTVALQPLKLYNSNAPFSNRPWGLAALLPDSVLYENSKQLSNSILSSSLIALGLGCILLVFAVRMATKPLLSIASQIKNASSEDLVVLKNTNTYEVNLLCDTINEMKRKGWDIENALREEGERYLLALESAIDTFIEYDLVNDRFRIYFFIEENQKQVLSSKTFQNFTKDDRINNLCHPSDSAVFLAVLCGKRTESCEMRLKTDIFPNDTVAEKDGEYYWFSFHAVQIHGEGGSLEKTIGSATNITEEKLQEFAKLEASTRDITTGVYNRDYGELLLLNQRQASASNAETCLAAISVDRFEDFKAYYGRVFSAALLREIGHGLLELSPSLKNIIRWSNTKFIALLQKKDIPSFEAALETISARIYRSENPAAPMLTLHAGIAVCDESGNMESSLEQAFTALHTAKSIGKASLIYEASMQLAAGSALKRINDAPIEFDISKESIVGFTFSLFEQTNDLKSALHMLIKILGDLFKLDQVVVCEYDQDFGTNRVLDQWTTGIMPAHSNEISYIDHADFENFAGLLNDMGILVFSAATAKDYSAGTRELLCIGQEPAFCALCCAMYDGGAHTGRVMFISTDETRWLNEAEIFSLYEVTKIICTRLNLEKSNSASRAKSEFLSKMSHEIRTPMNAIIGLTRIAKESKKDPSQVKNCLDKIDSSAKHLLSLINDVLDMSRIESGKLHIEKHPFSLTGLATYLDTLMRPQFEEKEITFSVTSEILHAFVSGDEQKLRQVLINLIGNALKFTPKGGAVTLDVSQQLLPGRNACLCRFKVIDNGVGIEKDEQNHIFDAFEQSAASNAAAGNPQGTGLGLAISNSFISAMGSRIELNSAAGEGSEFSFAVELEYDSTATEAAAVSKAAAIPSDLFRGKRALIVDDNDINLEIATFIIEDIGFTCEIAKDGREAVDKFLASEPGYYDIIFMDISMPVMDGLAATREIRKRTDRSDSRTLPIIAMTANAFSEDTRKSIAAGMNAHVAKPIDVDFLYQTLENLFTPGN